MVIWAKRGAGVLAALAALVWLSAGPSPWANAQDALHAARALAGVLMELAVAGLCIVATLAIIRHTWPALARRRQPASQSGTLETPPRIGAAPRRTTTSE